MNIDNPTVREVGSRERELNVNLGKNLKQQQQFRAFIDNKAILFSFFANPPVHPEPTQQQE
uniref:Uncharacterized protein n=1 Tax=Cucumis melo TaxID=3656 RepID=A0A9I9EM49_CUCME